MIPLPQADQQTALQCVSACGVWAMGKTPSPSSRLLTAAKMTLTNLRQLMGPVSSQLICRTTYLGSSSVQLLVSLPLRTHAMSSV